MTNHKNINSVGCLTKTAICVAAFVVGVGIVLILAGFGLHIF